MGCAASVGGSAVAGDEEDTTGEDWNASYKLAQSSAEQERRTLTEKSSTLRRTSRQGSSKSFVSRLVSNSKTNEFTGVNDYTVTKRLGKGNFGEVFLATDPSGGSYAIKILKASALKKMKTGRHGSAFDSVKTEIATMKKIAHPNCVHMFDVIADGDDATTIFLVLEYVDGGISQPIGKDGNPVPLQPRVIWSHMRHLMMGLEYLHTHDIIHRDIKPENLLLTQPATKKGRRGGKAGVLKIADFGTSCFCEGDANVHKTAGTPPFFSPELCTTGAGGSYDARAVDLWAVGVTVYMWACGRVPFQAPTVMLLMEAIKNAPDHVAAPDELLAAASGGKGYTSADKGGGGLSGLVSVIQGLLTKDPAARLSLHQLRDHPWITDGGRQPVPPQPVAHIELTDEEINQAVTNRAAIAYQSAAGPSALGAATGYRADWRREGLSTIRKRSTEIEARFYREIRNCGHLVHHVPVVYSIDEKTTNGGGAMSAAAAGGVLAAAFSARENENAGEAESAGETAAGEESSSAKEVFEIRMQDLATGMARPCAMALVMGNRTATMEDFGLGEASAPLKAAVDAVGSPSFTGAAEGAAAGSSLSQPLSQLDALKFLDEKSSTASLGFRIDAAKAAAADGTLAPLALPEGITLATLCDEGDVRTALGTFFHRDAAIIKAAFQKLEGMAAALERSAFFAKNCLLRTTLLIVYDDAMLGSKQPSIELKMMNFGFCQPLPEGAPELAHDKPWSGSADDHEDGYLMGVRNLERLLRELHDEVSAEQSPARGGAKRGISGKNLLGGGGSSNKGLGKKSPAGARPPPPASLQRI
jgi:serine/threonine protein kinase